MQQQQYFALGLWRRVHQVQYVCVVRGTIARTRARTHVTHTATGDAAGATSDLCKSAHQSFSHRTKSVSMSVWKPDEVWPLYGSKGGGNELARATWFATMTDADRAKWIPAEGSQVCFARVHARALTPRRARGGTGVGKVQKAHLRRLRGRPMERHAARADSTGARRRRTRGSARASVALAAA